MRGERDSKTESGNCFVLHIFPELKLWKHGITAGFWDRDFKLRLQNEEEKINYTEIKKKSQK